MDLLSEIRSQIASYPPALILPVVFVVGLLSSIHCIGMCGVFCMAATNQKPYLSWLYQVGRLFSYMILGGLLALIGEHLLYSLQPYLLGLLLIVLLAFALWQSKRIKGWLVRLYKPSQWFITRAQRLSEKPRAFLIGASSAMLPCGLLYTFLFAAMAVQSFILGLGIIFVFWLSTCPALQSLVYLQNRLPLLQRLQTSKWNYALLTVFFIYSLVVSAQRMQSLPELNAPANEAMICH